MVQVSKKCANLSKKSLIRSPQETMTEGLGTVKTLTCTNRCRLATLIKVLNDDFVTKPGTLIMSSNVEIDILLCHCCGVEPQGSF